MSAAADPSPADPSAGGGAGRLAPALNLDRDVAVADQVEVAASIWSRFLGLMGRRALAPGHGLWLAGGNGIHMMFMRFPIDAIFVGKPAGDGSRRVLATRRALPPWWGVVWYVRGAHGVLELPVGTVDRTGTAVGDRLVLEADTRRG